MQANEVIPTRARRSPRAVQARIAGTVLAVALCATPSAAAPQSFPGQALGPAGAGNSHCTAVSADGLVVAGYSIASTPGWLWSAAAGYTLLSGSEAFVQDLSEDGHVAVGRLGSAYYSTQRAVRWVNGGPPELLGIGGTQSSAAAVNADGSVVVGWRMDGHGGSTVQRPFYRDASGAVQFLAAQGYAIDVSADGRFVLGLVGSDAVVWEIGGSTTTIIAGSAIGFLVPRAISEDGTFVVGVEIETLGGNIQERAFRWSAVSGFTYVAPGVGREARCVDHTGTYFGIRTQGASALRYVSSSNVVQLAPLPGFVRSVVSNMSRDGRVLAGYSTDAAGGQLRATLWIDGVPQLLCPQTLHPACAPVPTVTGAFRLGGGQACTFQLDQAPSFSASVFFVGLGLDTQVLSPYGVVCAPPPFLRFVPTTQHTGGTCGTSFSVNLNQLARSNAIPGLVPGRQLVGHFWYRDASAPGGAAMSEAVRCILSL